MDVDVKPRAALASLVELAVSSDEPAALIVAAGAQLRRPLGLVDRSGTALGQAPSDQSGERAVSIARAAARTAFVAPPGWAVVRLQRHGVSLGVLAIGDPGESNGDSGPILRLLPALLSDQLRRGALMRLQRAGFVRRLVSSPALTPHRARREAAELGVELAHAYWIAVLAWRAGGISPEATDAHEQEALSHAEDALTVQVDGHLVLLHPAGRGRDECAAAWFEEVATLVRATSPASSAHAIAAEHPAGLDALAVRASQLAHLSRFGIRCERRALSWASEYALDDLLASQIDPAAASRFVEAQVGPLIAWDREHGTNLLGVLEAGLDFPRHDHAARQCFMHRNTFRHRLSQATTLLDGRLERPEGRLAVHIAIKMHRTRAWASAGRGLSTTA